MAHFLQDTAAIVTGPATLDVYVDRAGSVTGADVAAETMDLRVCDPFGGNGHTLNVNVGGTFGATANLTIGQVEATMAALAEALVIMRDKDQRDRDSNVRAWLA